MFSEMLRTEGEHRWGLLLCLVLACLAVPLAFQLRMDEPAVSGGGFATTGALRAAAGMAGILTLLAALLALVWGTGVWEVENATGWAYALSLPLGRLRLFGLRYLAGLAWLALPVLLAGAAGFAVAASLRLPPGLYAYPGPFAAWMALTAWFCYTLGFVLSAGVRHPLRWVLLPPPLLFVTIFVVERTGGSAVRWIGRIGDVAGATPLRLVSDYPPLIFY